MKRIKCSNCPRGILFEYDETKIKDGIIQTSCNWCKAIVDYDTKTNIQKIVKTRGQKE